MDIVVEFEWWHVPEDGHIAPGLAEMYDLSAPGPWVPILLGSYQSPRQGPLSDLKQVTRVVSDTHYSTPDHTTEERTCITGKLQLTISTEHLLIHS